MIGKTPLLLPERDLVAAVRIVPFGRAAASRKDNGFDSCPSSPKKKGEPMSLMEFCKIRDGALVPTYRDSLAPIRCDWCDRPVESLLSLGALWVCPECFGKAKTKWKGRV